MIALKQGNFVPYGAGAPWLTLGHASSPMARPKNWGLLPEDQSIGDLYSYMADKFVKDAHKPSSSLECEGFALKTSNN